MKRMDYVLIAALLVLSAAMFVLCRPGGEAGSATVYVDGEAVRTLSLSDDGEFVWSEGERSVRIVVEDGCVRVADSSCPDRDCVRAGAISQAGQSVVCLPNRVSVVLAGDAAPDAVLR